MSDEPQVESSENEETSWRQTLLGIALMAVIAFGVWQFFRYLEPDSITETQNPDFIDTIFANPVVVAAARIVLLSAAIVLLFGSLYVAVSVVVRIRRRQWLRRAGPFEAHLAEEAEEELEEGLDPLLELYASALGENDELARRLAERDEQLEQLYEAYRSLGGT